MAAKEAFWCSAVSAINKKTETNPYRYLGQGRVLDQGRVMMMQRHRWCLQLRVRSQRVMSPAIRGTWEKGSST